MCAIARTARGLTRARPPPATAPIAATTAHCWHGGYKQQHRGNATSGCRNAASATTRELTQAEIVDGRGATNKARQARSTTIRATIGAILTKHNLGAPPNMCLQMCLIFLASDRGRKRGGAVVCATCKRSRGYGSKTPRRRKANWPVQRAVVNQVGQGAKPLAKCINHPPFNWVPKDQWRSVRMSPPARCRPHPTNPQAPHAIQAATRHIQTLETVDKGGWAGAVY